MKYLLKPISVQYRFSLQSWHNSLSFRLCTIASDWNLQVASQITSNLQSLIGSSINYPSTNQQRQSYHVISQNGCDDRKKMDRKSSQSASASKSIICKLHVRTLTHTRPYTIAGFDSVIKRNHVMVTHSLSRFVATVNSWNAVWFSVSFFFRFSSFLCAIRSACLCRSDSAFASAVVRLCRMTSVSWRIYKYMHHLGE